MEAPSYPPQMPLYVDRILHRQVAEDRWATPVSFMQVFVLALLLFLGALWGLTTVLQEKTVGDVPQPLVILGIALVLPVVLLIVILLVPKISSPVWPYQVAAFQDPDDNKLRWNLAVVATAYVYASTLAQTEWLSQIPRLSTEERFRALAYIRRVRNRLQIIPALQARDVIATIIAGGIVFAVGVSVLPYRPLEGALHGLALMVVLESFMLFLFVQRWQHVRRLLELEEVFEELLPSSPLEPPKEGRTEDEVERWYREQTQQAQPPPAPKEPVEEFPPAPWE